MVSYINRQNTLSSSLKLFCVAMVQCLFSVTQSCSHFRLSEHRGRSSLQGQTSNEVVEAAYITGFSDLGALWQGHSGSQCIAGECPLPLVRNRQPSSGVGHSGTIMADNSNVCLPSSGSDFATCGQGAPTGPIPDSGGHHWLTRAWHAKIVSPLAAEP